MAKRGGQFMDDAVVLAEEVSVMGYFRIVWLIWRNWKYKPFRVKLRQLVREWEQELKGEISDDTKVVERKFVLPPPSPSARRRSGTELFPFISPENGEERNKHRTGTFMTTQEQIDEALARQGKNPDGSWKRPK